MEQPAATTEGAVPHLGPRERGRASIQVYHVQPQEGEEREDEQDHLDNGDDEQEREEHREWRRYNPPWQEYVCSFGRLEGFKGARVFWVINHERD